MGKLREYAISEYTRELRASLPARLFAPVPSRLLWLLLYVGVITAGTVAIAHRWGGWSGRIALALAIGHSFAGCAFVAHEALHGSLVRGRRLRLAIGWLGFLPFIVSPTLWVAWHNRVHHGHTAHSGVDPDTYPTLARYRESRVVRIVDHVSVGGKRWAGLLTLCFGFNGQSLIALSQARVNGWLDRKQQRIAIAQTAAAALVWLTVAMLVGPLAFVFSFFVPLLIGNAIVMGYILTNHSLSPLTEKNDPLLNSLSVTAPRLLEAVHLNFGYHVEHHLFPAMSARHARIVRQLLRERWPERYQSLSLGTALRLLWTTPRVYEDATTLVHPRRDERFRTLLPRATQALAQRQA